jgi:hypothetical protein
MLFALLFSLFVLRFFAVCYQLYYRSYVIRQGATRAITQVNLGVRNLYKESLFGQANYSRKYPQSEIWPLADTSPPHGTRYPSLFRMSLKSFHVSCCSIPSPQLRSARTPKLNCRKGTQRAERRNDCCGKEFDRPSTFKDSPSTFVFFKFPCGQLRFSGSVNDSHSGMPSEQPRSCTVYFNLVTPPQSTLPNRSRTHQSKLKLPLQD